MKILVSLVLILNSGWATAAELQIKEVAQGVFVHIGKPESPNKNNHGAIANIGFIVGDRCVAVIDTGGNPNQGLALKKAVQAATDKPVCYVINTHVHPDHIYGNLAFKVPGVKFIGHHKLTRAMAVRGSYYLEKAADQLNIDISAQNLIPPDLTVRKHMAIDLGGRELILTAHPAAHTDNDLTVFDKKTNTLWLSDLLFIEHLPVIDGSLKGWLAELKRLEKQKYKVVIPGHGPIVTDWPKSMQPEKVYLQALLDEIRIMHKQGQYLEEAIEKVGYQFKNQWLLFDQFHKKNVTTAFAELEWE